MIYRRGRVWWYKFKIRGQEIRESTSSRSRDVAERAERARHRELEEGIHSIRRVGRIFVFSAAAETWFELRKVHFEENTRKLYKRRLKPLKAFFAGRLLSDVTGEDVRAYQAKRSAEGASGRTVNMEVGILRQVMRRSKVWGAISDDVQFLKERRDVGRAISPAEETAILAAAADAAYSDSHLFTIVVLGLNTTMRSSEIRALTWKQIDMEKRTLTVGKSKTDAGAGRLIPLNQAAWAALDTWHSRRPKALPAEFVFPTCENHHVNPDAPLASFRTAWRRATKDAGLKGLRFHDLRHTAITKLAETSASDMTIMAISGHVSRRMLEHYSHIRIAAKRTALDAISSSPPAQGWVQKPAQSPEARKAALPN